jgi:hypothetical protein
MSVLNKKICFKVFCGFVVFFLLIIPQTTFAVLSSTALTIPVFDLPSYTPTTVTSAMTTAEKVKNYVLDPAARAIVKGIIQKLTTQTVNWINNGFDGGPAFVTDPSQFFLDVADTAASELLSSTKLNALCSPFKAEVRLALVKNYLQDNNNYACTLDTLKNNYDAFTHDFNVGGWDGWFEMTQTNASNPYGAYFAAEDQLKINIGTQKDKYQKQLSLGSGFLSYEKCKKGTEYTQAYINELKANSSWTGEKVGGCAATNKETITPGSVIESQLEKALGTGIDQLELTRSFDEIVSALVTQLYTRVVGGGKGLRSTTTETTTPTPTENLPFIVLMGKTSTSISVGDTFEDPGATAYDQTDGDITDSIVISGEVNTSTAGTYTITYSVVNSEGVSATPVIRTVIVVGDGGECVRPIDADKHTDPGAGSAITAAIAELRAGGMTWNRNGNQEIYECNRFEVIKLAAKKLEAGGSNVGLYVKTSGINCNGYSVDIMAFPDGYLYDVLAGGSEESEGINPSWGAASCDPVNPDKYKLASEI